MSNKLSLWVTVTALALASAPALANGAEHASRFGHMGRGGGFMMFGSLMMIVVVAAIVAIVFVVVRWIGGQSQGFSKAA